ncbi:MAG: hypothetical protein U0531_10550 [Dehalococcoidia bacterium]
MALLTIAAATLGVLVSFDLLKRGNDQPTACPGCSPAFSTAS